MKQRFFIYLLAVLTLVLGPRIASASRGQTASEKYAHPDMLAETDWLANHLAESDVRVIDLRAADAYSKGHIKNAVHLDQAKLRNPEDQSLYVPTAEQFAAMMSELGVSNGTRVVLYDDTNGSRAARLWFLLDYYGHTKCSLLNGGWQKWIKEAREVTAEVASVSTAEFKTLPPAPTACPAIQVVSKLKKPDVVILDVRSPEEYSGERVVGKRGGHIPGAINVEWLMNLTGDDVKVFKSAAELRRMYESLGITKDKEVITY
jgi:thiosulfate/3-mercaptopyruvate sulfurtransferase